MSEKDRNPFEQHLEALVARMVEARDAVPEASVPFGYVKVSKEVQLSEWLRGREDLQFWAQKRAQVGDREALRYDRAMQQEMEKMSNAGTQ